MCHKDKLILFVEKEILTSSSESITGYPVWTQLQSAYCLSCHIAAVEMKTEK